MKPLLVTMLAVLVSAAPALASQHASARDVCHARAVQASGYSGAYGAERTPKSGIRLSGSAQVGIVYSEGNLTSPGSGRDGYERLEDAAKAKYARIYDACMKGR